MILFVLFRTWGVLIFIQCVFWSRMHFSNLFVTWGWFWCGFFCLCVFVVVFVILGYFDPSYLYLCLLSHGFLNYILNHKISIFYMAASDLLCLYFLHFREKFYLEFLAKEYTL